MKNNHLLTFCVSLALIGASVLLTDLSATGVEEGQVKPAKAQTIDAPNATQKTSSDKKKKKEGESAEGTTPSTKAAENDSAPVLSPANGEVKGVSKSDNDVSPLPLILGGVSGLLHLLEIAGMVWAYLKIGQLTEKNRDSRHQIKGLTDKLSASEQKQKAQGDQLKTISSEVTNTRSLTSRINAIEQAAQRKSHDSSYTDPAYTLPSPVVAKAAAAQSLYPFLDTYRRNSDNFKNQYSPKIVSEDADNLQKRWSGDQQEIILREERQGNYWLFNEESLIYLIPNPKLKVIDQNMRTVGSLFNCENYAPGLIMTVVSPAVVSMQSGTNNRWKLEQKGTLEFN